MKLVGRQKSEETYLAAAEFEDEIIQDCKADPDMSLKKLNKLHPECSPRSLRECLKQNGIKLRHGRRKLTEEDKRQRALEKYYRDEYLRSKGEEPPK